MLTSKLEGPQLPRYCLGRNKNRLQKLSHLLPDLAGLLFYFNLSKIFVKSAKFFLVTRIFYYFIFAPSKLIVKTQNCGKPHHFLSTTIFLIFHSIFVNVRLQPFHINLLYSFCLSNLCRTKSSLSFRKFKKLRQAE
jgi:hypothetical protein